MEHVRQGFEGGGAFPYYDIWVDHRTVKKRYRMKPKSGGESGKTFQRVGPPRVRARYSQGTSQGRRPPDG